MRADGLVREHGESLVGRWVIKEIERDNSLIMEVTKVLNPTGKYNVAQMQIFGVLLDGQSFGFYTEEQITFLPDPHHEWALWLNEHMPSEGQSEWLQMVLDSVPEHKRLLTALALSVAHWHREAVPRGGGVRECALCSQYHNYANCPGCPYDCCYNSSHWKWACVQTNETADAVYEDLKALYVQEWRRANE